MDLQYENGKVQKIQNSPQSIKSPGKVNKIDEIKISPQKSRADSLKQKCI